MVIMADKVMVTVKGEGELYGARVKCLRSMAKMVAGKLISNNDDSFTLPFKVSLKSCQDIAKRINLVITEEQHAERVRNGFRMGNLPREFKAVA